MNPLDLLFGQIANKVREHASPDTPGPSYDANPLLGALSSLFGSFAGQNGHPYDGHDVQPASQDPYGDPGAAENVRPASEDPYGDPGVPSNVRPASEDPYGDPGR